jgi:hypothetical protein
VIDQHTAGDVIADRNAGEALMLGRITLTKWKIADVEFGAAEIARRH